MALPGYKNVTLQCTRIGTGNSNCTQKSFLWFSKNVSFYIEPGERVHMGPLGLMEARCRAVNSTVIADLQIYTVQDIHFTLTFTVKFNTSNDFIEESLTLTKDTVASGSKQGTPLWLVVYLLPIAKYLTKFD
ncbi:hypothetical protein ACJMK2_023867 [Sinanodonta woodiana]|uniref:Uncharacterized protein n=1 Tax=Sinanodonta woodiana TaxID=1069815 RepID=A0ABD3T5M1_SINWO